MLFACMLVPFLILHFGLTFFVVMMLGFVETQISEEEQTRKECVELTAILVIISQGLISVLVYGGSVLFPLSALFLGFTLVCHHTIKHWNSDFRGETCSCAPFQLKDIRNHETWVVATIVAAIVSAARL